MISKILGRVCPEPRARGREWEMPADPRPWAAEWLFAVVVDLWMAERVAI